ncbi:MAG: HAD family hydrolase [Candidatus Diapherotrites archaeon]
MKAVFFDLIGTLVPLEWGESKEVMQKQYDRIIKTIDELKRLKEQGFKLYVVSTLPVESIKESLNVSYYSKNFFDGLLSTKDSPEYKKGDADSIAKAKAELIQAEMKKNGIENSNAFLVGDSPMEQKAAKIARIQNVRTNYLNEVKNKIADPHSRRGYWQTTGWKKFHGRLK